MGVYQILKNVYQIQELYATISKMLLFTQVIATNIICKEKEYV